MPLLPFAYQSRDISFPDWVSLVTLCLAPLLAHVAAGAPQPSYLTRCRPPRWHDRICHYNPTSILWRYFAVTDRRIRARGWDTADIAAANALFWTDTGWDGSEKAAEQSLAFCSRLPARARAEFFSWEMIKTVVVGLQAAQAFYDLGGSLLGPGTSNYIFRFALDSMFLPIGCLGLYRFCAALWVTDDFAFADVSDRGPVAVGHRCRTPLPVRRATRGGNDKPPAPEARVDVAGRISLDSLLVEDSAAAGQHNASRFLPTSRWSSRALRICWTLPLLALTAFCVIYAAPWPFWRSREWEEWSMPASAFAMVIFYIVVFGASSLILIYYFIRGANTTTIIPCASMLWYKIYTIVISAIVVLVLFLVAFETAKTPCGSYSVWPPEQWHGTACAQTIIPVGQERGSGFGLAFRSRNSSETKGWMSNEFRVLNATGFCLLANWSEVAQRAAAFGLASMLDV